MINLKERAIIVSLNVSTWSGRKYDKQVSEEVDTLHNAEDGGRYNKRLVTLDQIRGVTRAARELREFHIKNTLPWEERAGRLLPTKNYLDYRDQLTALQFRFDQEVTDFCRNWEDIVAENRVRLNGLYKPSDFPTLSQLKEKFGAKLTALPVPESHFENLQGVNGDIYTLRNQAEEEITNRIEQAHKENWQRVKNQLNRMGGILKDEEGKIYHSLMDSLKELITLLPKLNIKEDSALQEVCTDLGNLLVPVEDLRKSTDLRVETFQAVTQIQKKFEQYF